MILVCDVGGTRTRFALAAKAGGDWQLTRIEECPTTPDVAAAVARFLRTRADGPVTAAAFGGAGPVAADGSIRLTNADVLLAPAELAKAAGVARAIVVNDFGAIAEAIPHIPAESLASCGGGRPVEGTPVVVLGPGTGLGTAIGAPGPGGWLAIAGDGGHADLAPVDDEELEIWQRLRRAHGRVSAETILCGPGLERLYASVTGGKALRVSEIDEAAWRGEPGALKTHALFTRWLGRVAGNLALVAGARGGVYLAGGILPRWGARFDAAAFRRAFEDKAPYEDVAARHSDVHRDASAAGPAGTGGAGSRLVVSEAPDTIVANATPPGRGGIGIVRISGPATRAIATKMLGELPAPRYATVAAFSASDGETIDAGLALYFPAPNSYTGEDVLELHGHGGPVVMDLLVARVIELGARLARPGEFSERAFHNDKLDLVQAEAIADLISAGSSEAARAALRSLAGDFSREVEALAARVMELRAYVEAAIDFPDEDAEFLATTEVRERLEEIDARFAAMGETVRQGRALRDGLHVVIAGRPNAGKSSLLNALAGFDAAIVTEIPGTTRDVLRERIHVDGLPIHIVDTAGLTRYGRRDRDRGPPARTHGNEPRRPRPLRGGCDARLRRGRAGGASRGDGVPRRLEQGGPAGCAARAGARGPRRAAGLCAHRHGDARPA